MEINGEKNTLNEWVKKTNLSNRDCLNKEEILHVLQILKKLNHNLAAIYLSLGNLYHFCFSDNNRAIKYLEKAILLEPTLIESYLSLTAIKFMDTKNVDEVLEIFNKVPKDIAGNDILIQQKVGILIEGKRYAEAIDVANKIANLKNRKEALILVEIHKNR